MKIRIAVTICGKTVVWILKFKQANEDDKKITMNKQREV